MRLATWLYIGLCGSGKTYHAKRAFETLKSSGIECVLIDDPKTKSEIEFHFGKNLIICDPHLCLKKNRDICLDMLQKRGYAVFVSYFEDDREKCQKNIDFRNDGRVINLKAFKYDLPPKGTPLNKIWTP